MMAKAMCRTADIIEQNQSPYLMLLAALLMLCSLILLSYDLLTDKQEQTKIDPKSSVQKKHPPESMFRVMILHEPADKAPPKKTAPTQMNNSKNYAEDHTPAIDASFSMPVEEYVQILERQAGAKLVLFDTLDRKILGVVSGNTLVAHKINLNGMSMRTRNITNDLPASFRHQILKQASIRHPVRFLIMLPKASERRFERMLAKHATASGVSWGSINSITLRYQKLDGHIHAVIQSVTTKNSITRIGKNIRIW